MKTKPQNWSDTDLNMEIADLKCQLDLYVEKELIDNEDYLNQYSKKMLLFKEKYENE